VLSGRKSSGSPEDPFFNSFFLISRFIPLCCRNLLGEQLAKHSLILLILGFSREWTD